jgi:hypothetical protein
MSKRKLFVVKVQEPNENFKILTAYIFRKAMSKFSREADFFQNLSAKKMGIFQNPNMRLFVFWGECGPMARAKELNFLLSNLSSYLYVSTV